MPIAIVTGASQGLGRSVSIGLARQGWSLVIDARTPSDLSEVEAELAPELADGASVVAVVGDVTDADHRRRLVAAAGALGGIDLVINNASTLGVSPLPSLAAHPLAALRRVYEVNVIAPVALLQEALALLRRSPDPRVVNVTSDAAVEAYEGWGGYGSSKAALDHVSAVLAAEEPTVRVWAVDPGDMRTKMHQDAFAGEDISDRPEPDSVVPALLDLVAGPRPSGRYRAADLALASTGGDRS